MARSTRFVHAKNHHLKAEAASTFSVALRSGKVERPDCCTDCGVESDRLQGHHDDYAKPLDVVWVCVKCHRRRHYSDPEPTVTVACQLPVNEWKRLKILVTDTEIPQQAILNAAITEYLDRNTNGGK